MPQRTGAVLRRRAGPKFNGPTPPDVVEYVQGFVPTGDAAAAARPLTAEMVRAAVLSRPLESQEVARQYVSCAAQLAGWSVAHGLPADVERVFHPDNVEEWIRSLGTPSAGTYPWRARLIGVAATTRAPWEPPPLEVPSTPKAFYTEAEVRWLLRLAAAQPDPGVRAKLQGVMVLGLGAGLHARELHAVTGRDFRVVMGVTLLDVPGDAARTVVVDPDWADEIAGLAAARIMLTSRCVTCPRRLSSVSRRPARTRIRRSAWASVRRGTSPTAASLRRSISSSPRVSPWGNGLPQRVSTSIASSFVKSPLWGVVARPG